MALAMVFIRVLTLIPVLHRWGFLTACAQALPCPSLLPKLVALPGAQWPSPAP